MIDLNDLTVAHALLRIAGRASVPENCEAGECGEVEFDGGEGWKVVVFYDVGDLDYIDHFVSPSGEKIDIWPGCEPTLVRRVLQYWRGTRDTARLLAIADWVVS